jgi:copper chaperone CopZ
MTEAIMRAILLTGVLAAIGGLRLFGHKATVPLTPVVAAGEPTARRDINPPSDTSRVRLTIRGMTCGTCATTARLALQRAAGVYRAEVSYDSASAVVWYDSTRTRPEDFIRKLREMTGYEARMAREKRWTHRPRPPRSRSLGGGDSSAPHGGPHEHLHTADPIGYPVHLSALGQTAGRASASAD